MKTCSVFPWQGNDRQKKILRWLKDLPFDAGVNVSFISLHQQLIRKVLLMTEERLKEETGSNTSQSVVSPGWLFDSCDSAVFSVTKLFFLQSWGVLWLYMNKSLQKFIAVRESRERNASGLGIFLHVNPSCGPLKSWWPSTKSVL